MEQQEQNSNLNEDWRCKVSDTSGATLKIADGEVIFLRFSNEGEKKTHSDFGPSIVFKVVKDNESEEMNWYVNPQNFSLLKQLKELGTLTGTRVKVTRKGAKKSDTRYNIEKE